MVEGTLDWEELNLLSCLLKKNKVVLQVGFLYLRYAGDPKTLWNWFEPYVKDDEVVFW
ncbi:hypothetical protein CK203_019639 [Vitis vinifera]|uniref:Pre-mRNA-splicing factor 38 n=1 Tax=Vitis vinifera TaxID=29760 RepID=A0A438JQW0_VITVI|nr:hypothetical protein CK203_113741 [Vitis vinifera]RVX11340.1 hypothetical protein CK203_019639 [Vitis vinifera]